MGFFDSGAASIHTIENNEKVYITAVERAETEINRLAGDITNLFGFKNNTDLVVMYRGPNRDIEVHKGVLDRLTKISNDIRGIKHAPPSEQKLYPDKMQEFNWPGKVTFAKNIGLIYARLKEKNVTLNLSVDSITVNAVAILEQKLKRKSVTKEELIRSLYVINNALAVVKKTENELLQLEKNAEQIGRDAQNSMAEAAKNKTLQAA